VHPYLEKTMSAHIIPTLALPGFARDARPADQFRTLLRYAVLAPSSHNSQPWQFDIAGDRLRMFADLRRWLRVADAAQRELFLSLGCALENFLIAADHFGVEVRVSYFPHGETSDLVAEVHLGRSAESSDLLRAPLFSAIAARHTNHREYDSRPLADDDIASLQGLTSEDGIEIWLEVDAEVRRRVERLVVRADALQFADPAWRHELAHWLSLGAFGTGWLMSKMSALAVEYLNLGESTSKKDSGLLRSAAALGVVTCREPDRTSQVQAGQAFERVFLMATARGIQLQPMNQVLQVPSVREEFAALLPTQWGEPQIVFRLGYAEPESHTPRRPLEEVLR
jgi:nitroreductase